MLSLFNYENYTSKFRGLITFEPLELKQSYIPHLKVLVCGINAFSLQWCGCIFISCYTHLKLALLLQKTELLTFLLASTVIYCKECHLWKLICYGCLGPHLKVKVWEWPRCSMLQAWTKRNLSSIQKINQLHMKIGVGLGNKKLQVTFLDQNNLYN